MVNRHDAVSSHGGRSPSLPEPNAEGAALLDNADVLARAVHTSPFGIVLSDLDDGTVLYVNEGFAASNIDLSSTLVPLSMERVACATDDSVCAS